MLKKTLLAVLSTAVISTSAVADVKSSLSERGITVEKTMAFGSNLNALLVSAEQDNAKRFDVIFSTRDNNFMIAGDVLNDAGGSMRKQMLDKMYSYPSYNFLKESLSQADLINLGDSSKPTVYLFLSPVCPHCAKAFNYVLSKKSEWESDFNIAIVPLGSERVNILWSNIYTSEDRVKALVNNYESLMNKTLEIKEDFISTELTKTLDLTNKSAQAFLVSGTPAFFIPTTDTSKPPIIARGFDEKNISSVFKNFLKSK